ncbi:unnamed protein product [Phytomonas sp. Hart1]|nr:unnamed protein product [Phytomonas sp. Hart1]|eukprot:CCW67266.1 unnamed protein product [Phytomonas sp. isolate Hart1]
MASREYIVGLTKEADFQFLSDALEAAQDNDVLRLQPGVHESAAPIRKNVVLITASAQKDREANAEEEEDIVQATLIAPSIEANVVLRNLKVEGRVDIMKGVVVIDECCIHEGADGIRVGAECRLSLKNSRVSHCSVGGIGVYFMKGSTGEVENTDVYECRVYGILVDGAEVALRSNRIRDSACGICFRRHASGLIEQNSVEYIQNFGICVTENSSPVVHSNRVQHCGVQCAYVSKESGGVFTENIFEGSIHVLANCRTRFIENRITGQADIDTSLFAS